MYLYERSEAVIDLDALLHNLDVMQRDLPENTRIVAVVKANAYGHGALQIASLLEERDDIFGFAVATAGEGISLRAGKIRKPIMILGAVFPSQIAAAVRNDLWMTVYRLTDAQRIEQTAEEQNVCASIQIAVDTGMNRIGYGVNEKSADEILSISKMKHLRISGMFTHFYASDAADKASAMAQYDRFSCMVKLLKQRGVSIPFLHVSNSAAIIDLPQISLDLVRAGIAMYGLTPSDEVRKVDLKPVMRLTARIIHVKTVPAGESISYGGTYTTSKESRIATIGFGYADGYPRLLSNRGCVLIRGKRAPIRGRICMDQFMVDVTDIPDAQTGDEAILIGRSGKDEITIEELGGLCGRFNYELACCISNRVPRVYLRHDDIVSGSDDFTGYYLHQDDSMI